MVDLWCLRCRDPIFYRTRSLSFEMRSAKDKRQFSRFAFFHFLSCFEICLIYRILPPNFRPPTLIHFALFHNVLIREDKKAGIHSENLLKTNCSIASNFFFLNHTFIFVFRYLKNLLKFFSHICNILVFPSVNVWLLFDFKSIIKLIFASIELHFTLFWVLKIQIKIILEKLENKLTFVDEIGISRKKGFFFNFQIVKAPKPLHLLAWFPRYNTLFNRILWHNTKIFLPNNLFWKKPF